VHPLPTTVLLTLALVDGATGFHPRGSSSIRVIEIDDELYYTLAQNPILYASGAARAALDSRWIGPAQMLRVMPLEDAVRVTQEVLGHGAAFPYPPYPLVKEVVADGGVHFDRPANVLLIFIEGLDRRFLGRTVVVGDYPAADAPPMAMARGGICQWVQAGS
jgi:hypothetical protein